MNKLNKKSELLFHSFESVAEFALQNNFQNFFLKCFQEGEIIPENSIDEVLHNLDVFLKFLSKNAGELSPFKTHAFYETFVKDNVVQLKLFDLQVDVVITLDKENSGLEEIDIFSSESDAKDFFEKKVVEIFDNKPADEQKILERILMYKEHIN